MTTLTDALNADPGVALAAGAPVAADATVAPIQVFPKTAPQDEATTDLLFHLREDVIPAATADSGAQAYVGGFQAVTVDFTQVLEDALPWFLLIVVGLGFLALVFLFRSLLVPATGALSSLLSLGAALGITVAVFQWGWFADLINLQATGPIFPFLPIMVFADPVRAVLRLPGVPGQPHARGVGAHRRQPQGGSPRAGRLRPGGRDRGGDHDQRVRRVHSRQRRRSSSSSASHCPLLCCSTHSSSG